jgi:hypothetical protein
MLAFFVINIKTFHPDGLSSNPHQVKIAFIKQTESLKRPKSFSINYQNSAVSSKLYAYQLADAVLHAYAIENRS